MNMIWYAVSVFVVSLLGVWGVLNLFPKMGLMDKPHLYGYSRKPVPYSVGAVIALLYLIFSFYFTDYSGSMIALFLAIILLTMTCVIDDYKKLSPFLRLMLQLIVSIMAVYSGAQVLEVANPFGGEPIQLEGFAFAVSVLWIMSLTNLMNFLDGVSGLSSGVGSIGFWIVFVLSVWPGQHVVDQQFVIYGSLTLAIVCTVFSFFEFYPPKLLLGDSGTMFIGFMLGVFSLINGGKLATVALVLLIPILDGVWMVVKRLYNKKSPFKGDLEHMHHKLLEAGFSERKVLYFYLILSLIFGLVAVFSWNSFFKFISLLLLASGLIIFGIKIWTQEKK